MEKFTTNNFQETQVAGQSLAGKILAAGPQKTAVVLGLKGELGAGKTTFLQGFAKGLGIKEGINSPTFVIMKRFMIYDLRFKNFYHFDCYRVNDPEEMLPLGFKEIISNPENIVAIEWPEKIAGLLPKNVVPTTFSHMSEQRREILF